MIISLIAAVGPNKEIGLSGRLPWNLVTDMQHFKSLTTNHTIIAGRVTYDSFRKKPLPDRTNIVITHQPDYHPEGVVVAHSLGEAIKSVPVTENEVFIVGGAGIYTQALPLAARLYLTEVDYHGPADTFFPAINPQEWQITKLDTPPKTENDDYPFSFIIYDRKSNI
jgi:dihydrofolate reductase